ncbi:MAG: CerR family C-terminal domain-containing protein [Rhizobiaceae bacterium]|nr:CerR family C-terminal domain-containing protein [Rhizobiaceae bacterium]
MSENDDETGRAAGAEATRKALLMAGLAEFGSHGFAGTSTRRIAAAAKANIGSIAYHFGGKSGLREACARFVVETLRSIAGKAVGIDEALPTGAEQAEERLVHTVESVVRFLVAGRVAPQLVQFVLREISHPGPVLDIMYSAAFEPLHKRLCQLWEQATGEPAESEETRIAVFTMIGQVVYLRIGREAVIRRMGWSSIGPDEAAKLAAVASNNLRAVIRARREARV